jgi:uncharacterized membrane protein YhiD involved in acid resistance
MTRCCHHPWRGGDRTSISRTLQGFLSGIGFLGGAVIFKSGFDVKGIKAAAAIWITGALGLAIATSYWWLGITVGLVTAVVMFVADSFPDEVREESRKCRIQARMQRDEGQGARSGAQTPHVPAPR